MCLLFEGANPLVKFLRLKWKIRLADQRIYDDLTHPYKAVSLARMSVGPRGSSLRSALLTMARHCTDHNAAAQKVLM